MELIKVCVFGSTERALELIANGTDINTRDKYGKTALHYAAEYVRLPVVKALLERGADPLIVDNENMNPLDSVITNGVFIHADNTNGRNDTQEIMSLLRAYEEDDVKEKKMTLKSLIVNKKYYLNLYSSLNEEEIGKKRNRRRD